MKRLKVSAQHPLLLALAVLLLQSGQAQADLALDRTELNNLDTTRLAAHLDAVVQTTLDGGIRNFTPYALFLVRKAYEATRCGDLQRADILSQYAVGLSPELPPARMAWGWVQWTRNRIRIDYVIRGYVSALVNGVYSIEDLSLAIFSNAAILVTAGSLTLLVFTLICILKYARLLLHDFRHVLPRMVPTPVVWGLTAISFVLPLVLGLSLLPCCMVWLGFLFNYFTRREKAVAGGLLGLCVLMPFLVSAIGFGLYMPQAKLIRVLERANYGFWDSGDCEFLEGYISQHPQDREVLLSLGLIHKREKNYRTAQRYYERLVALSPKSYPAYVNLGNVHLAAGRWQAAVDSYEHAMRLEPIAYAAASFNLARAYQQKFMFAESEQHMLRAQAIAPQPIDRALKQYSENYNRLVIDETVPRRLLWQKGYRMFCADGRAADDVWDLLFAGIPRRLAPFILICFGSGVLLAAWRDTRRIAAACPVCGKAFCHRCQKNIATETMCSQCLNFISKKDSIDFRLREGKMAGIRRHRTIDQALGAALSLCLSGAGHIWQARVVRGAIGLFLFFVLASKAVAVAALMSIVPLAQSAATLKLILLAVLLTVYWLVWAASFFRLQRRQRHDNLLVEATLSK